MADTCKTIYYLQFNGRKWNIIATLILTKYSLKTEHSIFTVYNGNENIMHCHVYWYISDLTGKIKYPVNGQDYWLMSLVAV